MMAFVATRAAEIIDWIDLRTGIRSAMREALDEPIRGGARWAYVFGSGLVFLILLQAITGIALTLYYVPSSEHAHASIEYIQKAVPGGALIRGLHHHAASAMIVLIVAHLSQVVIFGAYKNRREFVWASGLLMFIVTLAFAFTGYLLPWDQAAWFGTKVGTSVAGEIPLIGEMQRRIMLGGTDLTTITLSRFFTVHAFLLPLAVAVLVVAHIYLFRRAGAAGPFHNRDDHRVDQFYPRQVFRDTIFIGALLAGLVLLALVRPAELGPRANPSSDYLARPPWYFLPLFQLLKYFPGILSLIPTVILPGALFTLLFGLPLIDRNPERNPARRPITIAVLCLILLGSAGLIVLSNYEDRKDPQLSGKLTRQEDELNQFMRAPFEPLAIGHNPASENAAAPESFIESCAVCHGEQGRGGVGPALTGITLKPNRSPEDLIKILNNPRLYGLEDPMPESFNLTAEEKARIVEWLKNLK